MDIREEIYKSFKIETISLEESSTSRLVKNLTDDSTFAIISAFVDDASISENKKRQSNLKKEVQDKHWGFNEFVARWVADGVGYDEKSLLIKGISLKKAFELSQKYNQKSFIFKDKDRIVEICTNAFENYSPGDIVRTYHVDPNKPLNTQLASVIFSKQKEGPASKSIKGSNSKPFQLQTESFNLYESRLLNTRLGFTDVKIILTE